MSIEYLDKCYNNGIEITNIIGEDEALDIRESIEVSDTEVFDEFNNIISKDEELTGRIAPLKDLNKDLKSDSPFQSYPIVCYIVVIILFPILLLVELTEMDNIIGWLLALITCPFMMFLEIVGLVFFAFGEDISCW